MSIPEHLWLLTRRQVAELIHVHPTTIWRWIKSGEFPPGIPVGKCSTRWRHCDVQQWLVVREMQHQTMLSKACLRTDAQFSEMPRNAVQHKT